MNPIVAVLILAVGLSMSAAAWAQEGEAPIEREIRGDLNADEIDDLVLVLHDNDPANLTKPDLGMDTRLDTNPRMLAVALADAKGGYRLALANSVIIPRVTYTNESDPLSESGGVSIDRGSLVVAIYYFYSSGGSDTGHMDFRFRYEDQDFRLIGCDRTSVNRMSGEIETVSANFLNRKAIIKTGSISEDTDKTVSKRLKSAKVVHISDIEDPWAFAPEYCSRSPRLHSLAASAIGPPSGKRRSPLEEGWPGSSVSGENHVKYRAAQGRNARPGRQGGLSRSSP